MKRYLLFLSFVLLATEGFANTINNLRTDRDVERFVTGLVDPRKSKYSKVKVITTDSIIRKVHQDTTAIKWGIKNWEKADLNSDGRTDLLVNISWYKLSVFIVMDEGKGKFRLQHLSRSSFDDTQFAKVMDLQGEKVLFLHRQNHIVSSSIKKAHVMKVDTLIYRFNNFVELSRTTSSHRIDSITFETSGCYRISPIFKLSINVDGNAIYIAREYNSRKGVFRGSIAKDKLLDIRSVINYINIKSLDDNYRVIWTDDQTCDLNIYFKDGSVKKIEDYGMQGTLGLKQLYAMLSDLRESEKWHK